MLILLIGIPLLITISLVLIGYGIINICKTIIENETDKIREEFNTKIEVIRMEYINNKYDTDETP